MTKHGLALSVLSTALLLGACSDDDDDGGGGGLSGGGSIVGLWDISEEIDGVTDVFYARITPDSIIYYDYDGDQFDLGDNCYFIDTDDLEPLGGDRYLVGGEELSISTSGGNLRVSFVDTFDEDGDGNVTETLTETYPPLRGLSDADFNECV